ncbi:MAG: 16S rRNA (uracil(1498)-N(3))-methyltransferase [Saprospiraceae bacterium]|nr:16S rRNA (uracil(1498)-N(3))-methyltransferase [Saprospiraceae bacterium]
MQLFYTTDIRGNLAYFDETESRHLTQVLRRKVGDTVQFTDGQGQLFLGEIIELGKRNCVVMIQNTTTDFQARPFKLHIAIAPTKNMDRLEWFLEKATEIGIDEITPLICKRSERTVVKTERLKGIVASAMKQSLKTYLPIVHEATDFAQFMKHTFAENEQKFIAYCNDDERHPLSKKYEKLKNCVILIGPEGDFTEAEVATAFKQNFVGVSLGNSRLRTETAGVVACHTVNLLNE